MIKLTAIEITYSQVSQVQIVNIPRRRFSGITINCLTEKRQFKAEAMTIRCSEIACVVPPLGLKIVMVEMVAREFVMIAREGGPVFCNRVLRTGALQPEEQCGENESFILHG